MIKINSIISELRNVIDQTGEIPTIDEIMNTFNVNAGTSKMCLIIATH